MAVNVSHPYHQLSHGLRYQLLITIRITAKRLHGCGVDLFPSPSNLMLSSSSSPSSSPLHTHHHIHLPTSHVAFRLSRYYTIHTSRNLFISARTLGTNSRTIYLLAHIPVSLLTLSFYLGLNGLTFIYTLRPPHALHRPLSTSPIPHSSYKICT